MKRDKKKEYQKPEIIEHENLNEITEGASGGMTKIDPPL